MGYIEQSLVKLLLCVKLTILEFKFQPLINLHSQNVINLFM